jgi:hypothetical protein
LIALPSYSVGFLRIRAARKPGAIRATLVTGEVAVAALLITPATDAAEER